jgi:hypothetical protein
MARVLTANEQLTEEFKFALQWADRMFDMLAPQAMLDQPIPLRHPCIFYFGHLSAFAWNQIFRLRLGHESFHQEFDVLFERGIDPPDRNRPEPSTVSWPPASEISAYKRTIERRLWHLLAM